MRYIFLDIDGVLNTFSSFLVQIGPTVVKDYEKIRPLISPDLDPETCDVSGLDWGARVGLENVNPVCVAVLNKLLNDCGDDVALVLSSSHRSFFVSQNISFGSRRHLDLLRAYLTVMGVNVPVHFSITSHHGKCRGEQIDNWLKQPLFFDYVLTYDPNKDKYVILDDAACMLAGQNFIKIDPALGFSYQSYWEACELLDLPTPGPIFL